MATTYTLISSNVLTGTTGSVTFSSIPSTYTDLMFKISARTDRASYLDYMYLQSNLSGGYGSTDIIAAGTTVSSGRASSGSALFDTSGVVDGNSATTSTFGSADIYIPSYLASQSKVFNFFGTLENNDAANNRIALIAGLRADNTAINSITWKPTYGANFLTGSSFYLYGIKNS